MQNLKQMPENTLGYHIQKAGRKGLGDNHPYHQLVAELRRMQINMAERKTSVA